MLPILFRCSDGHTTRLVGQQWGFRKGRVVGGQDQHCVSPVTGLGGLSSPYPPMLKGGAMKPELAKMMCEYFGADVEGYAGVVDGLGGYYQSSTILRAHSGADEVDGETEPRFVLVARLVD